MNLPPLLRKGINAGKWLLDPAGKRKATEDMIAKQEDLARSRAVQRYEDILWLMSSVNGRRILYQLLERCAYGGNAWSKDARETDFLSGQRAIGVEIANEAIGVDLESWVQMQREALASASEL